MKTDFSMEIATAVFRVEESFFTSPFPTFITLLYLPPICIALKKTV